jgi:hypothetical protein
MLPAPNPVVAGCEKRPDPLACEVVVVPKSPPPPGWLVSLKAPAGLKAVLLKAEGWACPKVVPPPPNVDVAASRRTM